MNKAQQDIRRKKRVLQFAEQIEIEQDERRLVFRVGRSGSRIFYVDRDHTRQTVCGVDVEASTEWDGDDLIIAETTEDGSTLTERLTRLSADQIAHLLVGEDSRLFRQPVSIRSVYDRVAN